MQPPGPPPRTPYPGLRSPVDDRAPAGRINGYPTLNQATNTYLLFSPKSRSSLMTSFNMVCIVHVEKLLSISWPQPLHKSSLYFDSY